MSRPTTSDLLLNRILKELPELNIPSGSTVQRIRRGRHGISAGAWAWTISLPNGACLPIGSEDAMAACLKAKKLTHYRNRGGDVCVCAE